MQRLLSALGLGVVCCAGALACPGDLNDDGRIDQADLGILLASYGDDDGGDINGDGLTNQADLGALLAVYGTDCAPEGMILLPAGEFLMGDHFGEGAPDQLPVHPVSLGSFHMDAYEVTNSLYANGLNWALAQGLIHVSDGIVYPVDGFVPYCETAPYSWYSRIHWDGGTFSVAPGFEQHPMVGVSWYGAAAFANWRSLQEGRQPSYQPGSWACDFNAGGYRLPTEAEWEYAARGSEHDPYFRFPWGDVIDGSHANFLVSGDPWDGGPDPTTTPVGYYDGNQTPPGGDMANGYGLYDMAGNAWEWCNDWYGSTYYAASPVDAPRGPGFGEERVLRGGSWGDYDITLLCALRGCNFPDFPTEYYGFRLVLQ